MVFHAQQSAGNGGKILIQDDPKLTVNSRLPFCVIDLELAISIEFGSLPQPPNARPINTVYKIKQSILEINFGDVPVGNSILSFQETIPQMVSQVHYQLRLPMEAVNFIESKRTNDIDILLHLTGTYEEVRVDNPNQGTGSSGSIRLSGHWSFSQAKWVKFLSEIGYGEKWIVEIDRPKLEGFHEINEHIQKAGQNLFEHHKADDAMRDLRAAWDASTPYFDNYKVRMDQLIDSGSKAEESEPSKSKRIGEIQKWIKKFTQIGPHNPIYSVTFEDALMAYRLTVSTFSYLSGFLVSSIEENENENKG